MDIQLLEQAKKTVEQLKKQNQMLALAESCTGGLISAAITSVPGSSSVFDSGFITYSNESKIDMLGVPHSLVMKFGAVSSEVAAAMAEGALTKSGATIALSVTGIAGPDGGTPDKPVGLIYIGFARRNRTTEVKQLNLKGSRHDIQLEIAMLSLNLLLS